MHSISKSIYVAVGRCKELCETLGEYRTEDSPVEVSNLIVEYKRTVSRILQLCDEASDMEDLLDCDVEYIEEIYDQYTSINERISHEDND